MKKRFYKEIGGGMPKKIAPVQVLINRLPSKRLIVDILFRTRETVSDASLHHAIAQWGVPADMTARLVKDRRRFRHLLWAFEDEGYVGDQGVMPIDEGTYAEGMWLLGHRYGYTGWDY